MLLLYRVTHKPAQLVRLNLDTVELKVKGVAQPCQKWDLNAHAQYFTLNVLLSSLQYFIQPGK